MVVVLLSFIFGAVIGSFLSVLIWRLYKKETGIILGRSKCPKCNHILSAFDLIPIFSYIFLKGKCRYCGTKISLIYPFLELVTGLVFVLVTYLILGTFDLSLFLSNLGFVVYGWIIVALFVALAFYDVLFFEIDFCLAGILAVLLFVPQFLGIVGDYQQAFVLSISGFFIFLGISYLRKKLRKIDGLGGGDAIGAALLGLLLPILSDLLGFSYPLWLQFYLLIMLGFLLGGIIGIIAVLFEGKDGKFKLPFLPFMFLAIVLYIFLGKIILSYLF